MNALSERECDLNTDLQMSSFKIVVLIWIAWIAQHTMEPAIPVSKRTSSFSLRDKIIGSAT